MDGIGFVTQAVAILKATGPLGLAVIAGWWGYRKDRAMSEAQDKAAAASKAAYEQMVTLVAAQTAAMVKMESTISVLKDVINATAQKKVG